MKVGAICSSELLTSGSTAFGQADDGVSREFNLYGYDRIAALLASRSCGAVKDGYNYSLFNAAPFLELPMSFLALCRD